MALIVLASDKGSPGVTTTAITLAAVWPRRALLAELDPSGGDVALRLRGPRGRPAVAGGRAAQPGRRGPGAGPGRSRSSSTCSGWTAAWR